MPKNVTVHGAEVDEFLKSLEDLPGSEMVINPPGLIGVWRADDLRAGLRNHALCVHSSGMGLAVNWGKAERDAFTILMDRIMAANELAPPVDPEKLKVYMARVRKLFDKPDRKPKAPEVAAVKEDRELVGASADADPWRFE